MTTSAQKRIKLEREKNDNFMEETGHQQSGMKMCHFRASFKWDGVVSKKTLDQTRGGCWSSRSRSPQRWKQTVGTSICIKISGKVKHIGTILSRLSCFPWAAVEQVHYFPNHRQNPRVKSRRGQLGRLIDAHYWQRGSTEWVQALKHANVEYFEVLSTGQRRQIILRSISLVNWQWTTCRMEQCPSLRRGFFLLFEVQFVFHEYCC